MLHHLISKIRFILEIMYNLNLNFCHFRGVQRAGDPLEQTMEIKFKTFVLSSSLLDDGKGKGHLYTLTVEREPHSTLLPLGIFQRLYFLKAYCV